MAYGIIYQFEFDATKTGTVQRYLVRILKKDYTGAIVPVVGGVDAVQHQWLSDNPHEVIKGSNLNVSLVSSSTLSLANFFSVEDDTFLIQLYWGVKNLFVGYLVQTDCTEIQVDFKHYINLSFTDNLGLLKTVPLNTAAALWGPTIEMDKIIEFGGSLNVYYTPLGFTPIIGMKIIVSGSGVADGTYTIVDFFIPPFTGVAAQFFLAELLSPWLGGVPAHLTFITPIDLYSKLPLLAYLRMCLLSTNLDLRTNVYGDINAIGAGLDARMFEDVYLTGTTFLDNNSWKSCYDTLTIILGTLKCCLMQCEGFWNIIRFDELRYNNNQPPIATMYDKDFVRFGPPKTLQLFQYGNGSDIETGLLQSILRPYKFDLETYNFKQLDYILYNGDLQILGKLIRTYLQGANTIKEFEFIGWESGFSLQPEYGIRVIYDALLREIKRYVYLKGSSPPSGFVARSQPIELNEGDTIEVKFDIGSNPFTPGATFAFDFRMRLTDGSTDKYINEDKQWVDFPDSYEYVDETGEQWHSVDIISSRAPFSGNFYVYLGNFDNSIIPIETWYSSFSITVKTLVNESLQIVGQTNLHYQSPEIKNNNSEEVFIGDSPSNNISGTLFLPTSTGLLRDRTSSWNRDGILETRRLGEITTYEQEYWRRNPRSRMEGNLLGLVQQFTINFSGEIFFSTAGALNLISMVSLVPGALTIGDTFTITGSVSNDGTYTVLGVNEVVTPGVTIIGVAETVTTEDAPAATLSATVLRHLNAITILNYSPLAALSYIFGVLTINYKKNQANGTWYEQWQVGDVNPDISNYYQFKYLYKPS